MAHENAEWDERYASVKQVWSGQPNEALVAEVADLEPGTALDVGCGEGADAIWLASRGWQVTALEVSGVALERAVASAGKVGAHVDWVHSGLLDAALLSTGFDLVSAQYPALLKTPTADAERALLAAVGARGHLLVVHHAVVDVEYAMAHGCNPADYVSPADVAALLNDESWQVTLEEGRPRHTTVGAGAHHKDDTVLHAQRRT